jgi:hypothetical protein
MPDEHPAIIEMVPVGAMVVTVALRSGQAGRLIVALLLHEGDQALGQLERLLAVVGDAEGEEQVRPSHDAQTHAPVGLHHLVHLLERIGIHLDHVVEEAHREPHHPLELAPVELPPSRPLDRELGHVHRPEVARVVRQERLLAALVDHEAVGDHRVALRLGQVVDRPGAGGSDRDHRVAPLQSVGARVAHRLETTLLVVEEADLPEEEATRLPKDSELEQHPVGAVSPQLTRLGAVGKQPFARRPGAVQQAALDTQVQEEELHASEQIAALGGESDPFTRI